MLEVHQLSFSYSEKRPPILKGVSFAAKAGEVVAVLGDNGAGKSTLLKCLDGILPFKDGSVKVQGASIRNLKRDELAKNIAFVPQNSAAVQMTVYDVVLLGRKPHIQWDATPKDYQIVDEIIKRMGLNDFLLRPLDELSGGEAQKVLLARALVQKPKLLLLDEPTSNLALKNQHEIMAAVGEIARTEQVAVVVVLHDLNLALRYCDRFLLLHEGEVLAFGGEEVMTDESISIAYDVPVKLREFEAHKIVLVEV